MNGVMPSVSRVVGRVCQECEYWWPYPVLPAYGVCMHKASASFRQVRLNREEPCRDFHVRIHGMEQIWDRGIDFYYCGTCRESFHVDQIFLHRKHRVYTGVSGTNEDHVDMTLAGD